MGEDLAQDPSGTELSQKGAEGQREPHNAAQVALLALDNVLGP